MSHPDEYKAAAEGRLGADRMALGLSIIPDKNRGDMDKVATLTRQRDGLVKALEEVLPEATCRCDRAYTSRGRHEPNALCYLEAPIKAALEAAKETT